MTLSNRERATLYSRLRTDENISDLFEESRDLNLSDDFFFDCLIREKVQKAIDDAKIYKAYCENNSIDYNPRLFVKVYRKIFDGVCFSWECRAKDIEPSLLQKMQSVNEYKSSDTGEISSSTWSGDITSFTADELIVYGESIGEKMVDILVLLGYVKDDRTTKPICQKCGVKPQKNWSYCPFCGTKIEK